MHPFYVVFSILTSLPQGSAVKESLYKLSASLAM
jgi:hypothetical protein